GRQLEHAVLERLRREVRPRTVDADVEERYIAGRHARRAVVARVGAPVPQAEVAAGRRRRAEHPQRAEAECVAPLQLVERPREGVGPGRRSPSSAIPGTTAGWTPPW